MPCKEHHHPWQATDAQGLQGRHAPPGWTFGAAGCPSVLQHSTTRITAAARAEGDATAPCRMAEFLQRVQPRTAVKRRECCRLEQHEVIQPWEDKKVL
mmetsp:Transcript_25885/g.47011  ORF Transcript_25885/g.47011 Transcript_25885/m.47011 type:complete len:98 (+) Transcript_25885:79-372(+)